MTLIERLVGGLALATAIFAGGAGWNQLNNRIEQVDAKVGAIQTALGSTACTAILSRQIAAIEKGSKPAREALERLSEQYRCIPSGDAAVSFNNDAMANASEDAMVMAVENASLADELEAVDVLLGNED